jgi:hypothetical protein
MLKILHVSAPTIHDTIMKGRTKTKVIPATHPIMIETPAKTKTKALFAKLIDNFPIRFFILSPSQIYSTLMISGK